MRTTDFPTCLALVGTAAALVLLASNALANPPFINMLYPPPGVSAPREDASSPHGLPPTPAHAAACKESGAVKLALPIAAGGSGSEALGPRAGGFADLDAAASVKARSWRYIPAMKGGTPIAVRVSTTIV